MSHQILLVEDSAPFQILVKKALSDQNIQVDTASTAQEARELLGRNQYKLILLDVDLPDANGFDFLLELQTNPPKTGFTTLGQPKHPPVIFLTGMQDITGKVTAFSLGAEDYIVKPFDVLEFRARVEAKLRKSAGTGAPVDFVTAGDLLIRPKLLKAVIVIGDQEEELDLTPIEFRLLNHLAGSPDLALSRRQLLEAVWGATVHVSERTVDVHVCGLRRKLGARSNYIQSVPGTGYRFSLSKSKKAA